MYSYQLQKQESAKECHDDYHCCWKTVQCISGGLVLRCRLGSPMCVRVQLDECWRPRDPGSAERDSWFPCWYHGIGSRCLLMGRHYRKQILSDLCLPGNNQVLLEILYPASTRIPALSVRFRWSWWEAEQGIKTVKTSVYNRKMTKTVEINMYDTENLLSITSHLFHFVFMNINIFTFDFATRENISCRNHPVT